MPTQNLLLFSFSFIHPHVTSRLEKLMGSNLVSLTDRDYMQKLQERILEDYAESMDKRIKVREVSLSADKSNYRPLFRPHHIFYLKIEKTL